MGRKLSPKQIRYLYAIGFFGSKESKGKGSFAEKLKAFLERTRKKTQAVLYGEYKPEKKKG